MKKIIVFVLIAVFLFSLVGCEKDNKSNGKKYCFNCDEMISTSAKFCEHCGCNISQESNNKTDIGTDDYTFEDYTNDILSSSTIEDALSSNTQNYSQDEYEHKPTCYSIGCDNIPNNFNFYCSEHACSKNGCTFEKSFSSNYCSSHKCNELGCENARDDIGFYCSEHTCIKSGCSAQKSIMSDYCLMHDN